VSIVHASRSRPTLFVVNMDQQPHNNDFSKHSDVVSMHHNTGATMTTLGVSAEVMSAYSSQIIDF
jgi:hypothetical protein